MLHYKSMLWSNHHLLWSNHILPWSNHILLWSNNLLFISNNQIIVLINSFLILNKSLFFWKSLFVLIKLCCNHIIDLIKSLVSINSLFLSIQCFDQITVSIKSLFQLNHCSDKIIVSIKSMCSLLRRLWNWFCQFSWFASIVIRLVAWFLVVFRPSSHTCTDFNPSLLQLVSEWVPPRILPFIGIWPRGTILQVPYYMSSHLGSQQILPPPGHPSRDPLLLIFVFGIFFSHNECWMQRPLSTQIFICSCDGPRLHSICELLSRILR